MAQFEFSPYVTNSFRVSFSCVNEECKGIIDSGFIGVPLPDPTGDTHSDSLNVEYESLECPKCGKQYPVAIGASFGGGFIDIDHIEDEEVEIEYDEDEWQDYYEDQIEAFLNDPDSLRTFLLEIEKLKKLSKQHFDDQELGEIVLKQVYSGIITCLEEYLADKLINQVLKNDTYFRRFVNTFEAFRKEKISLSDIYEEMEKLRTKVKESLLGLIYHKLDVITSIYRSEFRIQTPSIGECMKIIKVRHDMVHRNGRTKDGEPILLDVQTIEHAFQTVEGFVKEIDHSILKMELIGNKDD